MDHETLKKVQPVLLEIAKEVKRVCDENGIRYCLYRGTFLGAVRHRGFIPWDDDMDIAMLRPDYEKFRRLAPEKLGKDYCFQDWHTDENYALPFGKVRKRGTLFVEAKCARLPENGLYVDIYPLDYAPAQAERRALSGKLLHLFRVKLMKSGYTPWMEGTKILWKKRLGYCAYQALALLTTQEKLAKKYDALVSAPPESETVYEQSGLPVTYYFEKSWFEDQQDYPFEDTTFAGPRDFDACLRSLYGNYMELPPADRRENRHQIQELSLGDGVEL